MTEEFKAFVANVQRVQQNELAEEFIDLFREDAIWTTAHGKRLTGKDAIAEFTRRVLPGATKEGSATYELLDVVHIRPDVVALRVRQTPVSPDGEPLADHNEGSPLYILSKEDGQWRLAVGQNTLVL